MGGGGWPNRHITFIVGEKAFIYSLFCSAYGVCGGRGWLKMSYGERGLVENVRIPSYRAEGSKIAQKTVI